MLRPSMIIQQNLFQRIKTVYGGLKMAPEQALKLAKQHFNIVGRWHDSVLMKALELLNTQGYHDPMLYAYSYSYFTGEYATTIINMDTDALSNPKKHEDTFRYLQNIEKSCDYSLLGIMFISEGTIKTDEDGNRDGFLVITFEDKIKGWKKVYQLKKQTVIMEGGKAGLLVKDLFYDKALSEGHENVMLEKFAHILRPNHYDKTDAVYN